jgi:hypothetical protein
VIGPILGLVSLLVVLGSLANFFVWVSTSSSPLPVIITHPLGLVAGFYLFTQVINPRLMGRQSTAESRQREAFLRGTGAPLAATRSGGRIGRAYLRSGYLKIEVYPGGILLKPTFMTSLAVLTSEISGVRLKRGVFEGTFVEIQCSSSAVNSPVALFVGPSSDVVRAIEHITRTVIAR